MPDELLEIEATAWSSQPVDASGAPFRDLPADLLTERRARDDLRRQIGLLEKRLGELFASAFPRQGIDWTVGAVGGPRVLGVAELERVRDALAVRLQRAQAELERRGAIEEANRGVLESMIADPRRHHWIRISADDVGEPGCRHWHSRPSWGLLGMLFGWWRVRLSSGCPLAKGPRPPQPLAPRLRYPIRFVGVDEQEAAQASSAPALR